MFKSFIKKYRDAPDESLMRDIVRCDERAFAELYHRYGARMHRYFYRMLWRDAILAEDFTQELFLKIIEKPHLYDTTRPFRAWIYALASNMCKNEYRRKKPADVEWLPGNETIHEIRLPEQLDRQLFETSLREAIDQLGETHKQCFVLRYQEELSVAEIAAITLCPEGTVKSRLHYALQKVSERLTIFKD
ncbi:MAG: RNA polymerase sigma factor [Saprospiraceae bacterium]|nr:RNA polymerase sigma factor [Saprospiraceae bacterium]